MMNSKQVILSLGLLLVVMGLCGVQGAALREKRQLNSLLTLSGEANARIENGTIFCDTLKCPPESFKCIIVKNNTRENLNQVEITRECLDPAGKPTAKTIEREANQFPGTHFESYAEIDKNGNIASFDNRGNSYNHSGSGDLHSYLYKQIDELHKQILDQLQGVSSSYRIP
uniref:Putative salivary protein n=1 Tax=Aedes albopictus TaxID=7160 RepID=A0A023EIP6_AEDAL